MTALSLTRRTLALRLAALPLALPRAGLARADGAVGGGPDAVGISHSAAAIHQEVEYAVEPSRVYRALLDPEQFDEVMRLSAAHRMATRRGATPTRISAEPGGSFALFGGYISGQQIELVPDQRIVQVWRAASWPAGAYSIAAFVLDYQEGTTRLSLDHRGFPDEEAPHLAKGWQLNYWQPLAQFLARGPKRKGERVTPPAG